MVVMAHSYGGIKDFTLSKYQILLDALISDGYTFCTFSEFLESKYVKSIVLRHDVDMLPHNSLDFALIQNKKGIKGTYYFRITKNSWNENIIKKLSELGHEIGYHYEDVSLVAKGRRAQGAGRRVRSSGRRAQGTTEERLVKVAIESFTDNLEKLRKIVPVRTICMHGSPMSRWDNRLLWKYYNYRDFDIIGEPYFDIDFSKVLYLTDTGRCWNGKKFNIRDRLGEQNNLKAGFIKIPEIHDTDDIIKATMNSKLPTSIMFNFHPQRWTDRRSLWLKEYLFQNTKNFFKYLIIKLTV